MIKNAILWYYIQVFLQTKEKCLHLWSTPWWGSLCSFKSQDLVVGWMLTQGARIVFYRILSHYNSLKVNTILNTTEQKWHSVKSGSHCNVFGTRKNINWLSNSHKGIPQLSPRDFFFFAGSVCLFVISGFFVTLCVSDYSHGQEIDTFLQWPRSACGVGWEPL